MKKLSVLIALSLFAVPAVYAQDGASCATAYPLSPGDISVDTTAATGWINTFGPLVSPSNDVAYTFTTGTEAPTGTITASAGNYSFAVYLLNSCSAGAGPVPMAALTGNGEVMDLSTLSLNPSSQYWVVVTGTAAGGPSANGSVALSITPTLPVTLQEFSID